MTVPHPLLSAYYEKRSERPRFVRNLFNETAPYYDRINQIFSLGSGAWYRRRCLSQAGLKPGMRVADIAIGTGLLAREAVTLTGGPENVIGVDLSEAMLLEARRKLSISLIQGTAEALPLADASVDFVTMGYALRHVSDLVVAFREFHRILKPGGTLLILEISKPSHPLKQAFVARYLGQFVPFLCRLTSGAGTQTLMSYYWETIEQCVPPATITQAMQDSGYTDISSTATFDLFRSYQSRKA